MERARRHQRGLARLALLLLALVAELTGRSLAHRLDFGRHVESPYSGAHYYPILLAVVKVAVALMLARVAWRFVKARSVACAARRLLAANGTSCSRSAPRVRIQLSPRLWLGSFLVTSLIYLLQVDAEGISVGRWPLLAPWLHTAALPVFAVLSVVVALIYRAVENWLSDYESYARDTAARASRLLGASLPAPRPTVGELVTPRSLFGLAFEVRPPPAPA
ncbi:MAG TPA: hypothetical protein VIM33_10035 [Gaiellaceae bacterium]|jgi:hypothetical protein